MRAGEAKFIGEFIGRLSQDELSPCLNIGSSTGLFRRVQQPHIHKFIFQPLEDRNVEVIHSDLKMAEGVDIAGSIYDPETVGKIVDRHPKFILCCNMFEHVEDRSLLASTLSALVPVGGGLLITVPYSYPIHFDPIDTYFRPTPDEIAELFPNFKPVVTEIIVDTSYGMDLVSGKGLLGTALHLSRSAIKFFMFWKGRKAWVAHFHRYLWFFRRYKISMLVLVKVCV